MSTPSLDRLLSSVNEFDASDLHLVVGVPPAYRVNGEIITCEPAKVLPMAQRYFMY